MSAAAPKLASAPKATASLRLEPTQDLEKVGASLDAGVWSSSSNDPQFHVADDLPLPGLYLFELDVLAIEGAGGAPKLYFDFGGGYFEDHAVGMGKEQQSQRPYSVLVRLTAQPRSIRVDPCSGAGEFLCSDLQWTLYEGEALAGRHPPMVLPALAEDQPAADARPSQVATIEAGRRPRTAVALHLYYEDLWPEMAAHVRHVPMLDRLYVSIPANATEALEQAIRSDFPFALVRRVPNRGRDILPFLQWLEVAAQQGIDLICKVHTKRSPHLADGDAWRRDMLAKLLGSPQAVEDVIGAFRHDPSLGIVAPGGHVVPGSFYWERNEAAIVLLCDRMGRNTRDQDFQFSASAMFWARVPALLPLRRMALHDEDFEEERGAADGTLAHAIERCFAVASSLAGYRLAETPNPQATTVEDFVPPPPSTHRPYRKWLERYEIPAERYPLLAGRQAQWPQPPTISIVMPVFDPEKDDLVGAIESVLGQLYGGWELCIADDGSTQPHVREVLQDYSRRDPRIKLAFRPANGGIAAASNSALELATGSFVGFLDHDDVLHPLALHFVAEAIVSHPRCELVYTDEDKIGADGGRQEPYFKCELNYELLLAHNMICHFACYRASRLRQLGGLRAGFEGAQDYDLALRFVEGVERADVVHVPRVLYHWRAGAFSTAAAAAAKPHAQAAARKAIADHLARSRIEAQVFPAPGVPDMNRVRFEVARPAPRVDIVIPTRDRADLLVTCVDSIRSRSTYPAASVIIVDNGSRDPATFALFERLAKDGVKVIRDESEFNFSALNNRGVDASAAEFVCLMNNDIEVVSPDWLEEMVGMAARPRVGAVGARLWYPDYRLQHGGVILGIGGVAGHSHKYLRRGKPGYCGRAVLHQEMSAVTAACLLIRRQTYLEVGGLDETLPVAFNDIDFCLRLRAAGYRNVWTPYAELLHHESATRGYETTPEKKARLEAEVPRIKERWGPILAADPAYSPNLTLDHEDFSIASPPRVELFDAAPQPA